VLLRKNEKTSDDFWQEYEEKIGEKILSRGLGKYICGWDEFDEKNWGGIWGLLINTSGGFRFLHFAQYSWMDALTQFAQKEPPKEKSFFLHQEKIISSEIIKETKWWKKILNPSPPRLVILYADETGTRKRLVFEAEFGIS